MAEQIMITIVDDEQDMRESISQWLSLSGYKTVTYPLTNSIKKSEESSTSDIISKLAAAGWSCANDATSGTTYYYHNQTRETRWENPLLDKK